MTEPRAKLDPSRRLHWLVEMTAVHFAAVLVCVGIWVYRNSLDNPGIFDDGAVIHSSIVKKQGTKSWIPRPRQLVFLSVQLNHAVGGMKVRGYRQVNRLVHILNALLLFGLCRQTLLLPARSHPHLSVEYANWFSFSVALLWLVHPLQTQAVTYMAQRLESMMATCYLMCMYCLARGHVSNRATIWYVVAVLSFVAGVGTKEVIATVPLAMALYDRTFLVHSWREMFRKRWGLYVTLVAPMILFAFWVAPYFSSRTGVMGFGHPWITSWMYARTQPSVILHYLWVALWPRKLCLDLCWPVMSLQETWPSILAVGSVGLAVIFSWLRRPSPISFLILTFFVILAPTSSFMPINDLAFEHRMYLPLACLCAVAVSLGFRGCRTLCLLVFKTSPHAGLLLGAATVALVAIPLALRTVARNGDYAHPILLWQSAVDARPEAHRARFNLGSELWDAGRRGEAVNHFRKAFFSAARTVPYPPIIQEYYLDYRRAIQAERRSKEVYPSVVEISKELPENATLHMIRGELEHERGNYGLAIREFQAVIAAGESKRVARKAMANSYLASGDPERCIELLRQVVSTHKKDRGALNFLSWVLSTHRRDDIRNGPEALRLSEYVCYELKAEDGVSWGTLAGAYAETGNFDKAVEASKKSVKLAKRPGDPAVASSARAQLRIYQKRKPYRTQEWN